MAEFKKGDSVTGKGRLARTRYVVKTAHRDGTYTVRALFVLNPDGSDMSGSYLGYLYRVTADELAPLTKATA